jgi:hypothetical protein
MLFANKRLKVTQASETCFQAVVEASTVACVNNGLAQSVQSSQRTSAIALARCCCRRLATAASSRIGDPQQSHAEGDAKG